MKKNWLVKMLATMEAILIAFALGEFIAVQEAQLPEFQITLLPVKERLYLAEPLRLFVGIQKVGESTFWGALEWRSWILEVKKQGSGMKVFKGSEVDPYQYGAVCGPFPIPAPPEIWKGFPYRPGFQRIEEKIIFYYFRETGRKDKPFDEGLVFAEPGIYQVRVFIGATQAQPKLDFKVFASKPIQIEILELPANEREPMKLWVGEKQARMFVGAYLSEEEKEDVSITLRRLMDDYPNSIYRPYAMFALAGGLMGRVKSSQEADLMERLAQEYPEFPFLDKILWNLYEYYLYEHKDLQNARIFLKRLKNFLYSDRIPGLKKKVEEGRKLLDVFAK